MGKFSDVLLELAFKIQALCIQQFENLCFSTFQGQAVWMSSQILPAFSVSWLKQVHFVLGLICFHDSFSVLL